MSKVCMYLTGANRGIDSIVAAESLAKLYDKPPTYFDSLCRNLFELKKSYKLLNSTAAEIAEQHRQQLEALGFQCSIQELKESSGLTLVPVEAAKDNGIECPACEKVTTDPDMCSECGVIITKFLKQQKIESMLDTKLASAERSHQRVLKAQAAEEKQANIKNKKAKKTQNNKTEEPELDPDAEGFQAHYEDTERNKVFYYVIAATVLVAIGAGSLAYMFTPSNASIDLAQEVAVASEASTSEQNSTKGLSASNTNPDSQVLALEPTIFSQWQKRLLDIKIMKHQLEGLNAAVGMSSTMQRLVANIDDPLTMTIGKQYLAQLKISDATADADTSPTIVNEYEQMLNNNQTLIEGLPNDPEKLLATISLYETLTQLGRNNEAKSIASHASAIANLILQQKNPIEHVFARTMMAEYTDHLGAIDTSISHYDAAIIAAKSIDNKTAAHQGSIPFITRSKAQMGQFADAHALLGEISDPNTRQLVMADISRYAAATPIMEIPATSTGIEPQTGESNESMFSNDPDLMILFEKDKKMKQQAKKLNKIVNILK